MRGSPSGLTKAGPPGVNGSEGPLRLQWGFCIQAGVSQERKKDSRKFAVGKYLFIFSLRLRGKAGGG